MLHNVEQLLAIKEKREMGKEEGEEGEGGKVAGGVGGKRSSKGRRSIKFSILIHDYNFNMRRFNLMDQCGSYIKKEQKTGR